MQKKALKVQKKKCTDFSLNFINFLHNDNMMSDLEM